MTGDKSRGIFRLPVWDARNRPNVLGVTTLGLFVAAVVLALNSTHGMPLVERKTVTISFEDLSGLNEGDDVRIAGTRVGFVDEMKLEDGHAVAVLKLDNPKTKLYQNARVARVSDRSGLGQKFIQLDPGSPSTGPLRGDTIIPEEQTVKGEDLNQLLDAFDADTRRATSSTLKNLGGGMIGHGDDLAALSGNVDGLLRDTGVLAQSLSAESGEPLVDLLDRANRLSFHLVGQREQLALLTEQLSETVAALKVDEARHVDEVLQQSPGTLDDTKSALMSLNRPLTDTAMAMQRLRPGASALGMAVPDARGVLREGLSPLRKMPAVNGAASPAIESLTDLAKAADPVSRQLVKTSRTAGPLGGVLGDYSFDISNFFTNLTDGLSHGDAAGHWLRIVLIPGAESIAGPTALVGRDPYPAPSRGLSPSGEAR